MKNFLTFPSWIHCEATTHCSAVWRLPGFLAQRHWCFSHGFFLFQSSIYIETTPNFVFVWRWGAEQSFWTAGVCFLGQVSPNGIKRSMLHFSQRALHHKPLSIPNDNFITHGFRLQYEQEMPSQALKVVSVLVSTQSFLDQIKWQSESKIWLKTIAEKNYP